MKIINHNKCNIFVTVAQSKSPPRFNINLNSLTFSFDNFPKSTVNMTRNSNVQIRWRKWMNQLIKLVTFKHF
jgi:hypothetical protein